MHDSRVDQDISPDIEFLTALEIQAKAPSLEGGNTYVIVETMLEPSIRAILVRKNVFDVSIDKLFRKTPYDALADKGPIIALVPTKNDAFTELMTSFQYSPAGCFIQSKLAFKDMVDWARQRLTVHKNEVPALLRFYEPRMLLPLLSSFEPETKAAFLKDIDAIEWFDHRWLSHSTNHTTQENASTTSDATNKADSLNTESMKWLMAKEHLAIASKTQQEWIELNDHHA